MHDWSRRLLFRCVWPSLGVFSGRRASAGKTQPGEPRKPQEKARHSETELPSASETPPNFRRKCSQREQRSGIRKNNRGMLGSPPFVGPRYPTRVRSKLNPSTPDRLTWDTTVCDIVLDSWEGEMVWRRSPRAHGRRKVLDEVGDLFTLFLHGVDRCSDWGREYAASENPSPGLTVRNEFGALRLHAKERTTTLEQREMRSSSLLTRGYELELCQRALSHLPHSTCGQRLGAQARCRCNYAVEPTNPCHSNGSGATRGLVVFLKPDLGKVNLSTHSSAHFCLISS